MSNLSVHPGYDKESMGNDIAVLELEDLIGGDAAPACLPKHPLSHYLTKKATVSGYGLNNTKHVEGTKKLQILEGVQMHKDCPQLR